MLPKSVNVTVLLKNAIPANAEAVAVLIGKQPKAGEALSALLDAETKQAVLSLASAEVATGKSNEVTHQLISVNGKPRRLLVVGLGSDESRSVECFREAGGVLAKAAKKYKLKSIAVIVPKAEAKLPVLPKAAALAGGFVLGSFNFLECKGSASTSADEANGRSQLILVSPDTGKDVRQAVDDAVIVAEAQNFARTIASRPGNDINPPSLAEVAKQLAKEAGLSLRVLDEKQMAKLGMGGILAVGAGSKGTPPRMIVLEHKPAAVSKRQAKAPLLVVGKAITFDTGGISIKPADKMQRMIFDKCGGMAVLGLMYAVAKLKLPTHVVGILSSAENHISETAYRPGDVLKMYNGVTVEVTNTDAEGRLVLGDALAWGIETYKPAAVVNLATLTGGVVVALGKTMAGVMSNDDALVADLHRAATNAGEKIWRLPVGEDQREHIKSDPADIVNSAGREGSPLQGAAFLSYFVKFDGPDKIPWAHLDIAGVADTEKEQPLYAKGATGWGVRTLVEWVVNQK